MPRMRALSRLEYLYDMNPSMDNLEVLEKARSALNDALKMETEYWREKANLRWMQEGDRNTKDFHNVVMQRRQQNFILKIRDDNGNWVRDPAVMSEMAVDYYQKLFSSQGSYDPDRLVESIPQLISDEQNVWLCSIPSDDEIKEAVHSMAPDSSPGPDGFTGRFFIHCINIVCSDVCAAVRDFFRGR